MAIKFVARANLHHLGEFLAGKCSDAPQEALQILDIVLRELSIRRFFHTFLLFIFFSQKQCYCFWSQFDSHNFFAMPTYEGIVL